jgi:hypothetical protein
VTPENEAVIHELVKDRMIAFRAEDWLDIQKPQTIPVEVQLPPAALESYRQMERDYFLTLTDAEIEAVAAKVVAEVTKKTGATLRG